MSAHSDEDAFVRATSALRQLFNLLAAEWNELHRDLGVSSRMRALMEHLAAGPATVPEIARAKSVSRQHIQIITNELLEGGLAERQANPAHARSSQISLTPQGQKCFAKIARRERSLLARLHPKLVHIPLEETALSLESLIRFFESAEWRELAATCNPKLASKHESKRKN